MEASLALVCGGKALVCGSRPWRGRRQARFVTRLHFCHQQFVCSRRTEACLWHETDVSMQSPHVRYQGMNGPRSDPVRGLKMTPDRTSLIKTKFFVGAIGRDLADPPGAP